MRKNTVDGDRNSQHFTWNSANKNKKGKYLFGASKYLPLKHGRDDEVGIFSFKQVTLIYNVQSLNELNSDRNHFHL